ncbi:hypothetical protein [Paraburkholderia dipogonis]|uniref:hypothetical protein n=1 Tax=Paraburkholderia dipogonis TaxID=1211383 RepID=UPI0036721687
MLTSIYRKTAVFGREHGISRAICRISVRASFRRWIGKADFQPKAPRRNRVANAHL